MEKYNESNRSAIAFIICPNTVFVPLLKDSIFFYFSTVLGNAHVAVPMLGTFLGGDFRGNLAPGTAQGARSNYFSSIVLASSLSQRRPSRASRS